MKILADENCGGTLLAALRDAGHDVKTIVNVAPGLDDEAIFAFARNEKRVLLTYDRDFGYIAERAVDRPPAIFLMRMRNLNGVTCAGIVVQAIADLGENAIGHFVVIEPVGIRSRPYKD